MRGGIEDVRGRGTAENAAAQRGDHGARVDDGAHRDARRGAAILGGNNAVLRNVDKAPREIAGVCGLERGVGETLARAMRRIEVLEHREPFLEIADDRGLDDLA